ncbi:MAG: hypothetical protein P8Y54_08615 [Xanthomonadales bacterium]
MSKPGANRFEEMLARNHAFAGRTLEPGFPLAAFNQLQDWQQERLSCSFADLYDLDHYRPAIDFFLTEVYGGLDFRDRDQDMGQVMPVMVRFLPDRALVTLSEAFELQAISLEFDERMARFMDERRMDRLDMDSYGEVYRECSDREGRERQILLIHKLGYDLDKLVQKSWINTLVRLLRGPAIAAGFGRLQAFLETGLASFRALDDATWFVDTIYEREWAAMERLFRGDPDPFLLQGKVQPKCSER